MVYVSFLLGLLMICKGGDWFVDAASGLAEISGIPRYVIGATIVSFATTMPEMIVSVAAALQGHP
ncbi:MAG: sodium:calcium antiporter, partial [Eubacterium sp.]|nr:sodium:calcium antiporter [Eubacterium sp.]